MVKPIKDRMDANETTMFLNDLRSLMARTYEVDYPKLQTRDLVPRISGVPAGARTWEYRQFDSAGSVAFIEAYSNDLPRVDIKASNTVGRLVWIGNSYGWSELEVLEEQFAGGSLTPEKARIARDEIERAINYSVAFGTISAAALTQHGAVAGMTGFYNNPAVATASVSGGTWATKIGSNPSLMITDLAEMVNSVATTTNEYGAIDTIAMPPSAMRQLAQTYIGTATDQPLLTRLGYTIPGVRLVTDVLLETAGAGGTRMLVGYRNSPDVLGYVVAREFEQTAPFKDTPLSWAVGCTAKIGGTVIFRPLEVIYRTGI